MGSTNGPVCSSACLTVNTRAFLFPSSDSGCPCVANKLHHPAPQDTPHNLHLDPTPVTKFTPTPTYSPRPSCHESGSTSEYRPSQHGPFGGSRRQHSESVYVKGQRIVNAHGKARRERILLAGHLPTPYTPRKSFYILQTTPDSSRASLSVPYRSSPHDFYRKPYIVDERSFAHIHVQPEHHGVVARGSANSRSCASALKKRISR